MVAAVINHREAVVKKTVDFVLFPDALGLDITGPLEVFNTASLLVQRDAGPCSGYALRFFGPRKGRVCLSSGIEVYAPSAWSARSACDTLVVPGGEGTYQAMENASLLSHLRETVAAAKRVVSVCSGAFVLAAAGLLDGREATTHWMVADDFRQRFPRVRLVADAIYTRDGRFSTSAGVTAGIDLALALVEEDFGLHTAVEVSRHLLIYFRRPGSQSQFSTPLEAQAAAGRRFARLHRWLLANLTNPISVEAMAARAAMSTRNFSRVFKATTGMTPTKYLETLRLDRAREILSSGSDSVERIAEVCGFGREDRLRRAFLRRFRVTPSQYRFHFQ
jgi:transcriptional regulator GlxA family with amidase domain